MRSGQLAEAAGVNLQTLRYYERRGLLPEPDRSLGGHRDYGPEDVARVRAVKAAQRLGFTLGEIQELISLGSHRGPRPGLGERAAEKLTEIDERIADLQRMRRDLVAVIEAGCVDLLECTCTPHCPIPFTTLGAGGGVDR